MAKKKGVAKWVIATVIPLFIVVLLAITLLVVNIYIPVKYLSAYFVKGGKNNVGELRVTYLDMEFGDSALVELPDGKTILIDGGDGVYSRELSLIKFLNSRSVDTIDFLICTSVKKEHCGGLAEVVKYKNIGKAYIPYSINPRINDSFYAFVNALNDKGTEFGYCSVGEGYCDEANDCFFTFLAPTDKDSPQSEYALMNTTPNAENIETASAVVWLQFGESAFAFTSDAHKQTLKRIVESYKLFTELEQDYCKIGNYSVKLEECDVVSVPAHGGARNTYAPWYDLIKPEYAILSVGKSFADYPSLIALSDVCAYTQPIYTMEKGNITISVKADKSTIKVENL